MDKAINKTLSLCPQYMDASNNLIALYNNFTFNDSDQLSITACETERLKHLTEIINLFMNYNYIMTFFIGTVGASLALCCYTFLKEFNSSTFYYFRAINIFDLIYLITYIGSGFNLYVAWSSAPGCVLFIKYFTKISGKSSRYLVSWLAFERSLACQWPKYYPRIDSKRVALFVIMACLILAFTYNSPSLYFDIFGIVKPELPITIFEQIFRGLEGLVMLILTPIVVSGFVQMSRQKRRLINNYQLTGDSLKQINTNKWLCALQLCEGIPSILLIIVGYLSYLANFSGLKRSSILYLQNETFDMNVRYQKLFEIQQYFVIFVSILDAYNHGGHFYTYFLCSPKFRSTLVNAIKRKINVGKGQIGVTTK